MIILVLIFLFLPLSVGATVHNVTTAGELTTAMSAAVAGDEIVLANGTYAGTWTTNNAGSSGNTITLRAENRHQAILQNTRACGTTAALTIADQFWTVDGLRITQQQRGVSITASNVTIRNNIIEQYDNFGIRTPTQGLTNILIEENVIGHGATCTAGGIDPSGIEITSGTDSDLDGTDDSTVRRNIIFATGNNGNWEGTAKKGYGILVDNNSDNNTFQGNLLFANGGKGTFRLLAGSGVSGVNNNVIDSNAIIWGEGENSSGDCMDDSNTFSNNLIYESRMHTWSTKGNGGDTLGTLRGHHTITGNTFYYGAFSGTGVAISSGGSPFCFGGDGPVIGYKINNTFTNNIIYSPNGQDSGDFHTLMSAETPSTTGICAGGNCPVFSTANYNLFWANDSTTSDWIAGTYSYGANDIHAFASQPTFTNAAAGDFSLTVGSVGKGAASDSGDMGVRYNTYLRKAMLAQAFALPTTQNDSLTGVTSTSFAGVSTTHYYQVYFWIPISSPCSQAAEQFTIEGVGGAELVRDITANTSDSLLHGFRISADSRWFTLGRHIATDGTLNVSWQHTSCVEKVFIRKLPTSDEAFTWLALTDTERNRAVTISSPLDGSIVPRKSNVTIEATWDQDPPPVTSVTYAVNGQNLNCGLLAMVCNWLVPNPANRVYRIRVAVLDADGNTGVDQVNVRSK